MAELDALLSPSYTHTDASGTLLTRAEWLEYASGRADRTAQIAFQNVSTRIDGETAIVTGVNELSGGGLRNASDSEPLVIRFTQVWIWRDGRWLREAFQATPVAPPSVKLA